MGYVCAKALAHKMDGKIKAVFFMFLALMISRKSGNGNYRRKTIGMADGVKN